MDCREVSIKIKLYSYVITHDTGFAPNPFWGYCTLACCKPAIRRTSRVGDWIAGISRKSEGNKLIYAMRVDEALTYELYYRDKRFKAKIPDYKKDIVVSKCGDNIYKPLSNGHFQQLPSIHSKGINENSETKAHDLSGKNVLISRTFYYFGSKPLDLPKTLIELMKVSRGHKNKFHLNTIKAFIKYISEQTTGVNYSPNIWPQNDDSWKRMR